MKKVLSTILLVIITIACIGCGAIGSKKNGAVLFSTEYDIEDYCQDCFIVSKTDGLLYGVVDMNGKEILPVSYDDIYFLNKDDVVEGYQSNVYLKAEYEDEVYIFNNKGNQIFDIDVSCVDDKIIDADENSPFFYSKETKMFYREDGSELFNYEDANIDPIKGYWISNEYYLSYSYSNYNVCNVCLYNVNDGLVKTWGLSDVYSHEIVDGKMQAILEQIAYSGSDSSIDFLKVIIDKNGNILEETRIDRSEVQTKKEANTEYLGQNGDIKLYKTNSTWKLEDKDGNALYDERYYECYTYYGDENDCYILLNEDSQPCLISRNGVKLVDYGFIDCVQDREEPLSLNGMKTDGRIYEGVDSVCFAVKNEGLWDIYYFNGK